MTIRIQTTATCFFILSLFISACAPASPTTAPGQATAAGETSMPPVAETATPTLTSTATATLAPVYPLIAPETLGQLRLLWNVNFLGDIDRNLSCNPAEQECTLWTNIAGYAFSWDGSTLAAAVCFGVRTQDKSQPDQDEWGCTAESAIILYDAATGAERGRLAPAALPLSLAFHPDGNILAAGLANSGIELWDVSSGELSGTLSGSPKYVGINPLAFTPDGNLLISGGGLQLQLWDWSSLALLSTIERIVFGIGISPDSRSLVTLHFAGSIPDAIRVYDLPQVDRFSEIPLYSFEFSFNPRNGWMSSMGHGANASFWDPVTNAVVATLDFMREWEQANVLYDLSSGGFTPSGYFLLTRIGQLSAPEAQPEATGLSETLWACGFALADMEANQTFFSLAMLYDECAGPEYMYDMGLNHLPQILSPDGRFIAADDAFGNLRVWGIDASQPGIAPECFGDC